jgi:hypothetical protein
MFSIFDEDYLKKIKIQEKNPAVLGQVIMWMEYLKEGQKPDLFNTPYPFLEFGGLESFDLNAGLDDKTWVKHEEEDEAVLVKSSMNQLPLFT